LIFGIKYIKYKYKYQAHPAIDQTA
jgi:hypothetical protein